MSALRSAAFKPRGVGVARGQSSGFQASAETDPGVTLSNDLGKAAPA